MVDGKYKLTSDHWPNLPPQLITKVSYTQASDAFLLSASPFAPPHCWNELLLLEQIAKIRPNLIYSRKIIWFKASKKVVHTKYLYSYYYTRFHPYYQ